jgi:hypothetical protein
VLEKIDGMNMRAVWNPYDDPEVYIYGRTDRAQIPGDLMEQMRSFANTETFTRVFGLDENGEPLYEKHPSQVVLFGEGYGPGIQQGGHYRADKDFALFDVCINGRWCRWDTVTEIAEALDVETVPVLGTGMSTEDVQILVSSMCDCTEDPEWRGQLWHRPWLSEKPEGVIARTDPYLFDGRGRRVMFKHKVRDVKPYLDALTVTP